MQFTTVLFALVGAAAAQHAHGGMEGMSHGHGAPAAGTPPKAIPSGLTIPKIPSLPKASGLALPKIPTIPKIPTAPMPSSMAGMSHGHSMSDMGHGH